MWSRHPSSGEAVLYLPVGMLWSLRPAARAARRRGLLVVALCAGVQVLIEVGRAFTGYRHPDVTNVLLAAVGTAAGIALVDRELSRSA